MITQKGKGKLPLDTNNEVRDYCVRDLRIEERKDKMTLNEKDYNRKQRVSGL